MMRRVIALLLVLLLAGCDDIGGMTDAEYVAKAQDYLDKGELKAASIELKNALSKNPGNAQARWLLGKLYVEIGNGAAAEKELSKAQELGVSANSVTPLLARALLLQGKVDDVLALGGEELDEKNSLAELLAVKGAAFLAKREIDNAEQVFNQALRIDKKSARALTGLAGVAVARRDIDAAYRNLDKALTMNPRFAPAWSYKGDLDRYNNKPASALLAYGKAIENRIDNASDILKRAELLLQEKKVDEAQADADLLRRSVPNSWRVKYLQGRIYLAKNRLPEAQESLEYAIKLNREGLPSYFFLGAVQYLQGNLDSAEQNVGHYYSARKSVPVARRLLALIKLRQGRFEEAEKLVHPLVLQNGRDVLSLNILANAFLAQGRSQEAIEFLGRIVELTPQSAAAQMRLGIGLLKGGDKDAGFRALEKAIQLDPALQQAEVKLVMGYIREKEWNRALDAARAFSQRHPDDVLPHTLLGLAYRGMGEKQKAKSAFEHVLEIAPGDPTASINLAAMAVDAGDLKQAKRYYEGVLSVKKKHLPTQLALAALYKRQGDEQAAIAELEKAVTSFPESVEPRVILAREYLSLGKAEKARSVLGEAVTLTRDDPMVLATQGQIELATRRYVDAKLVLQELVRLWPNSAQAHSLLGMAYQGLNDNEAARREFERSLQIDPDSEHIRIALATVLLLEGRMDQARKQMADLKDEAMRSSDALAVMALLQAKQGERGKSIDTYRRLYQRSPSSSTVIALARALWLGKDREEAVAELNHWLSKHPKDVPVRLMLANDYAEIGRQDEAIQEYERVLELVPDNQMALNNVAWLLRDRDPVKGLGYAEKAWQSNPESVVLMDTLAELLLVNGKLDRAERLNQRALVIAPDSAEYRYRKARILEKQGNTAEAREILEDLLKQDRFFKERGEAEVLLDELKRFG